MTSIGYNNLYGSVGQPPVLYIPGLSPGFIATSGVLLGGGIKGFIPQADITTNNDAEFETTRFLLKEAWNTNYKTQIATTPVNKPIQTPFRVVNNAGDLLSRKYYCNGGSSIQAFRPNVRGLKQRYGANQFTRNGSNPLVPSAACNPKFVYDSSDYTRYMKQKASVKNYNNLSNGGDQNSGSQVAWKAIRRY
jgi:hypothetical protein